MKKLVLPLVVVALLFWIFTDKCNITNISKEFKNKQDSLIQVTDSLQKEIHQKELEIGGLNELAYDLQNKVDSVKAKVIIINKWIDSSKKKIDTYTEAELISSFNKRYPTDTITNTLPLAQPVLVSAAKDLVELDGAKDQLIIKDSIIALDEEIISTKDVIINVYKSKESDYRLISSLKDIQIKDYKVQYDLLKSENKKLKIKNKFTKITTGIVIGGLTYLLISK
jgi:predicted  nucleic acid-binding Zn-ribbon protein